MNAPTLDVAHETVGNPMCPRCGSFAMFTREFWPLARLSLVGEVGRWYHVACHCGWTGRAQKVREVAAGPANRAGR